MGKIADRLANKSHPLYSKSKQLFKDYRQYYDQVEAMEYEFPSDPDEFLSEDAQLGATHAALEKRLEDILKTSSGSDFMKWTELLALHSSAIQDSADALQELLGDWARMAVFTDETAKTKPGVLVGMPVRVGGKKVAWQLDVPEGKQQQLVQLLQQYDFIGEDVKIQFMPRLLSVNECAFLDSRALYHIRRAFVNGNPREAYRLMLERRMLAGAGLPDLNSPAGDKSVSMGLLLAYVECEDLAEALPVENQLNEVEGDEDAPYAQAQYSELLTDVYAICEKMEAELSEIFPGYLVTPTQHLQLFLEAKEEVAQDERRLHFTGQLEHHGFTPKDAEHLVVMTDFKTSEDGLAVEAALYDSRDKDQKKFTVQYVPNFGVSPEESLMEFANMVIGLGLKFHE